MKPLAAPWAPESTVAAMMNVVSLAMPFGRLKEVAEPCWMGLVDFPSYSWKWVPLLSQVRWMGCRR
ncbi:hypothetical protein GCM10010430_73060 [Kitasatospora cystarginea]|uniref:Uncharacterized protein n=1 Tax=Kitasatospora cystarginea TaxID=58350 RepID=A0ABN3EXP9_9ACTN